MRLSGVNAFIKSVVRSRPYSLEKPVVVQFPVIDICNSRCQMCKIWENKKSDDITVEQLSKGLDNDLYSEVRSVGVNGGEPTLRKDLPKLVEVLFEKLPKLEVISLITNGFKYKDIIEHIEAIGVITKKYGGRLDVMVSLDGFEDVHDRVRGKPGNFENAKNVIAYAKTDNNVANIRVGCTVIKENVFHLHPLLDFCQKENVYVKYRLGIPHKRLYTENLLDPYSLSFEEKYELTEFLHGLIAHYEVSAQQIFFYRSLIGQVMHSQARMAGCDWQHRGATITSKGELLYCAVESDVLLNNIAEGDSEKAFFGNQSHLSAIKRDKCAGCNHDYVGIPPRRELLRQLAKRVEQRFSVRSRVKRLPFSEAALAMLRDRRFASNRKKLLEQVSARSGDQGSSERRERSIIICGWYGTETLGDKAILGGIVNAVRQIRGDSIKIYLVSLNEYVCQMTKRQMPELRGVEIIDTEVARRLAPNVDTVMFGGGPIMAVSEVAEMEAIFAAGKKGGAGVVVAGCGVGPLGGAAVNHSIKGLLQLADYRVYRDQRSLDYAKGLGVDTSRDIVAEDPAFSWLSKVELVEKGASRKQRVLALGLREFPYRLYARHLPARQVNEIINRYETSMLAVLEQLVASDSDLVIRPVPMCTNHFGSDDRWFYRRLFRRSELLAPYIDDSLLGPELEPSAYVNSLNTADALLGMRFHSLVFGVSLGIPCVALDYTLGKGKVKSLAERFDIPCESLSNIDSRALANLLEQQLRRPRSQRVQCDQLSFFDAMAASEHAWSRHS